MAVLSHLGPTRVDSNAVVSGLSVLCRVLGIAMLLPAVIALALGDVNAASALLLGAASAHLVAYPLSVHAPPAKFTWSQAFTMAGAAWLLGAIVASVPLALSGHYSTTLQAVVEGMAGLTTTGASFVEDLDHLSVGINLWRHLLHPIGAVGALLVVATIRLRGETLVSTSTVAEAGEHRILPRRGRSLRSAGGLVLVWSLLGSVILLAVGIALGLPVGRAGLHAFTLATSAFSTGGFTLTSASAGALHSATVQLILAVLMIAGATSMMLHRALWARRHHDLGRELDVRVMIATSAFLTLVVLLGLSRAGVYDSFEMLARQGLFTTIAAHTTTGMSASSGRLIATGWGDLAPAALVAAMGIGGMGGSIAGGVGTLRVGLIAKGVVRDIRRLLLPESALVVETYQQSRRHVLTDSHVRAAATVLLLMLAAVFAGAVIQLATSPEGDLPEALFAATSAVSTTGLSVGFVGPASGTITTLTTGLLMWFGRLEFLAVLASIGMVARVIPGVGGRG